MIFFYFFGEKLKNMFYLNMLFEILEHAPAKRGGGRPRGVFIL
jgi:hypothetical protein